MANLAQLEQAKQALHELMIGKKAVKLQQNGRSVEFQPADIQKLKSYIAELETNIGTSSRRRGPAGIR